MIDNRLVIKYMTVLEIYDETEISEELLKAQFRKLTKIYHPDATKVDAYKDGDKYIRIKEAYEYLQKNIEEVNDYLNPNAYKRQQSNSQQQSSQAAERARREAEAKRREEERKRAEADQNNENRENAKEGNEKPRRKGRKLFVAVTLIIVIAAVIFSFYSTNKSNVTEPKETSSLLEQVRRKVSGNETGTTSSIEYSGKYPLWEQAQRKAESDNKKS